MSYQNQKVKARQSITSNSQQNTLGVVCEVPMGDWNATLSYQKLNTVRYNGATWIAKKPNQNIEPMVGNGWQEVWQVQCYDGSGFNEHGTYPDITAGNATQATNDETGQNIAQQFTQIRQDIENESHFRGVFTTVDELKSAYPTATPHDYAYITGGNIWVYENSAWTDSEKPVPASLVPASTSLPLMNGTAQAGTSNNYSRGDHVHPSDTSKVSKSDLDRILLDFLHPVGGNPYIQFPNTPTPATIWAGTTWEIDTTLQGKVVVGSGGTFIFGNTGGSANAVVVSHRHQQRAHNENYPFGAITPLQGTSNSFTQVVREPDGDYYSSIAGAYSELTTETAGESGVGKNMPPYVVINYWKRIS